MLDFVTHSAVAQLVERLPVKELVIGSNPTRGAKLILLINFLVFSKTYVFCFAFQAFFP